MYPDSLYRCINDSAHWPLNDKCQITVVVRETY